MIYGKNRKNYRNTLIVGVQSVEIQAEYQGIENQEMKLLCVVSGSRPKPRILWSLPEGIDIITKKETWTLLVGNAWFPILYSLVL